MASPFAPRKDHDPRCDLHGRDCSCGLTEQLEKAVQHLLRVKPWRTHEAPEWLQPLIQALETL